MSALHQRLEHHFPDKKKVVRRLCSACTDCGVNFSQAEQGKLADWLVQLEEEASNQFFRLFEEAEKKGNRAVSDFLEGFRYPPRKKEPIYVSLLAWLPRLALRLFSF